MLLIDSGNSAIKTRSIGPAGNDDRVFSLLRGVANSGLADYLEDLEPAGVCIASVTRGDNHDQLLGLLRQACPRARLVELQTLPALGSLVNAYADHRQLGVDRWLSVVAASDMGAGDALVIDAGTAVKLELLSAERGYLGGLILPGFNTSQQRFRGLFADLDFDNEVVRADYLPGTSTAECIRLLPAPLTCERLQPLVAQAAALLQPEARLILAGQDARRVADCLGGDPLIVDDLVFRGMLKQLHCLG